MVFAFECDRKALPECQGEKKIKTSLTVKVRVGLILDKGSASKVDQLQTQGLEVDQEVLVLQL